MFDQQILTLPSGEAQEQMGNRSHRDIASVSETILYGEGSRNTFPGMTE